MILGSILHGAYGDYYEQMVCLKAHKRRHPDEKLELFFASPARLAELRVLDLSFADGVHLADEIGDVPVDRYLQYQVKDPELAHDVLAPKHAALDGKLDLVHNLKPWSTLRRLDLRDPAVDVDLGALGRERLPAVMRDNDLAPELLDGKELTVGFLWRYRNARSAISPWFLPSEEEVLRSKSELVQRLVEEWGAHVLVCGMNLVVTDDNRSRVDAKYTPRRLAYESPRVHYLRGLGWALELEILRRASLCVAMPSGFSEALWIKRRGDVCLVDAPPHYLLKLVANRMPLFDVLSPSELWFQLRQPHTSERVLAHLRARAMLPS